VFAFFIASNKKTWSARRRRWADSKIHHWQIQGLLEAPENRSPGGSRQSRTAETVALFGIVNTVEPRALWH